MPPERPHPARPIATFAPGWLTDEPGRRDYRAVNEATGGCPGCAATPSPPCACCGAPAVVATLASSEHSANYCERCWQTVLAVRAEVGVAPSRHPLKVWHIADGRPIADMEPAKQHQQGSLWDRDGDELVEGGAA